MAPTPHPERLLSIGAVADRSGLAVSAVRFYADEGLITAERSPSGHRRFARATLRRLSFIQTCQRLGYSLDDIRERLDQLPDARTPTERDWSDMAVEFSRDIDERIRELTQLRDSLESCIGCGCLSLGRCAIWNPEDIAGGEGPGARYLIAGTVAAPGDPTAA